MAVIIDTLKPVYGVPTEEQMRAPVVNLPTDATKARFRFRSTDFAQLFIRTKDGIRRYVPEFINGAWVVNPELEQGRNATV